MNGWKRPATKGPCSAYKTGLKLKNFQGVAYARTNINAAAKTLVTETGNAMKTRDKS